MTNDAMVQRTALKTGTIWFSLLLVTGCRSDQPDQAAQQLSAAEIAAYARCRTLVHELDELRRAQQDIAEGSFDPSFTTLMYPSLTGKSAEQILGTRLSVLPASCRGALNDTRADERADKMADCGSQPRSE